MEPILPRAAPPAPIRSGRFGSVLLRPGALFTPEVRRHPAFLFGASALSTAACVLLGNLLFPGAAGLVAVALVAFSLLSEMVLVLEENREAIWVRRRPPREANLRLAAKLLAAFLGMFLGFAAMAFLLPEETARTAFAAQIAGRDRVGIVGVDFGEPWALLTHNGIVLVGCFLFGLFFRAGGALLVLGWNASVWGAVYGVLSRGQPSGGAWYAARVALATGPHIALESSAYVLAAIAGIFVSKGIAKHGLDSNAFWRVAWSSLSLLVMGLGVVAAAAWAEALLAPWLVRRLFA